MSEYTDLFDQSPEAAARRDVRAAQMDALYHEPGLIEWHTKANGETCSGRHGVVRNVKKARWNEVLGMLNYYFGHKCAWREQNGRVGIADFEFIHMTKVYPPPTKPWEWCGESVLFEDWRRREQASREAIRSFKVGDKVSFEGKGKRHYGLVVGGEKRLAIVVEGEGKWYVPPAQVRRES